MVIEIFWAPSKILTHNRQKQKKSKEMKTTLQLFKNPLEVAEKSFKIQVKAACQAARIVEGFIKTYRSDCILQS